jgi:hypothetical protein
MRNGTVAALIIGMLGASMASASGINVMGDSQVSLAPGDSLFFYLSSSYASHAPPGSLPGEVSALLAGLPLNETPAAIPGTSGVYMPGVLFGGTVESLDGSVAVPLLDANAAHLGLPAGDLLLTPGWVSGGWYSGSIVDLSAAAIISSPEAAALFGSGEFVLEIHDLAGNITFGYPGAPITDAFSAATISPDGTLSVGARTTGIQLTQAPEPGTIGLLLAGLTCAGARWRLRRRFISL